MMDEDCSLENFIARAPETCLGKEVADRFDQSLPFLLKILSIRSALSIQVHPDKKSAERLHSLFPDVYKDPNYKPEVAIALTPMTLMCDFRPYKEIAKHLQEVPELHNLVGLDLVKSFVHKLDASTLKAVYCKLMEAKPEEVSKNINSLMLRIKNLNDDLSQCIKNVYNDYKEDVGLFSLYIFNILYLERGQAIYLGPNIPHSYISGDCVECMATSDNVVRAGLTPKYKDVQTLIDLLDFEEGKNHLLESQTAQFEGGIETLYKPPIEEFQIMKIELSKGTNKDLTSLGPSLMIILGGEGTLMESKNSMALKKGSSVFIAANSSISFTSTSVKLEAFIATTNLKVEEPQ